MANNEQRSTTVATSRDGDSGVVVAADIEKINQTLAQDVDFLCNIVDSPQTLQILRNTLLLALFASEKGNDTTDINSRSVTCAVLLSDDLFRTDTINALNKDTAAIWSDEWNSAWRKDAEPLYSRTQQYMSMRASLITFWTREWNTIPEETRRHVAKLLVKIVSK